MRLEFVPVCEALREDARRAWDLASRVERGVSSPSDEMELMVLLARINDVLPTVIDTAIGRR